MSSDLVQQLMATSLGSTLTAGEAAELVEKAKMRDVAHGDALFTAGDPGDALYVIVDGSFDVVLGSASEGGTVVAKLAAGQVVGELEVMTRSARVASLIATDEARALELPAATFHGMLDDNRSVATKLVTVIAKTLARRLAAVNQRIVSRPAASPAPAAAPSASAPPPTLVPDAQPTAEAIAQPVADDQVEEISDAEVAALADDDLDVLDKLWG